MTTHFRIFSLALAIGGATFAIAQQPGGAAPQAQPPQLSPALQQLSGLNLKGDAARKAAAAAGLRVESRDARTGKTMQLVRIVNGEPVYYTTHNWSSASTIGTLRVHNGWSPTLQGTGIELGIWDAGWPHPNHVELSGRITMGDSGAAIRDDHATHVAGTMIAAGLDQAAKGMAPLASLRAYDWNDDASEMENAPGIRISNHSYGAVNGWEYDSGALDGDGGWVWYGPADLPYDPDFGRYDSSARDWDTLAVQRPHYLIFKAAGNDRDDTGPGAGQEHEHYDNRGTVYNCTHEPDGDGECIGGTGAAKNIMVVGAIEDVLGGWAGPSTPVPLSSFSSVGPSDDLRIKPDIVANGVDLYSCLDGYLDDGGPINNEYGTKNGTSMASPSAAGSAALLLEYWRRLDRRTTPEDPWSATLKGLIIHSARALQDKPTHFLGWGMMDTQAAAVALKQNFYERNGDANNDTGRDSIRELVLIDGEQYETTLHRVHASQRVRVTICWTDPAHAEILGHNNPNPALVNDLDVRVIRNATGTEFKPWRLEVGGTFGYTAVKNYTDDDGNTVDNVEVVEFIAPAGGDYTVRVSHKGALAFRLWDGSLQRVQPFSLIMTENHRQILRLQLGGQQLAWQIAVLMSTSDEGGAILVDTGTHQVGAGGITISQPITLMSSGGEATLN